MKKLLSFMILSIFFLSGCSNFSTDNYVTDERTINGVNTYETINKTDTTDKRINKNANYITIKYRDTLVDVSEFESFDTSKSSFIEKAYYDEYNQYLILNLDGTYYHWCNVPKYIWEDFKESDSLGKYYNQYIKGEYDCRLGYIPQYN